MRKTQSSVAKTYCRAWLTTTEGPWGTPTRVRVQGADTMSHAIMSRDPFWIADSVPASAIVHNLKILESYS